ncbi:MAG: universal stress protein [Proteobacteria bacterium]|nr:universal stress protein [Pseudomonadota bacterium]MBU4295765.1 universal stress protein [Pseudomonadota bacterium]MCG2749072.1 universal stress protein [Desulfobulbaceae bacterium]
MNRILVAVETGHPSVSATVYALNLAQRIQAQISFLLIDHLGDEIDATEGEANDEFTVQKQLLSLISDSNRRDGVKVNFYVGNGSYETELINFVQQNKISLLIVGFPAPGQQEGAGRFLERLMNIKQKINCRIMIVSEKLSSTSLTLNPKRGVR